MLRVNRRVCLCSLPTPCQNVQIFIVIGVFRRILHMYKLLKYFYKLYNGFVILKNTKTNYYILDSERSEEDSGLTVIFIFFIL